MKTLYESMRVCAFLGLIAMSINCNNDTLNPPNANNNSNSVPAPSQNGPSDDGLDDADSTPTPDDTTNTPGDTTDDTSNNDDDDDDTNTPTPTLVASVSTYTYSNEWAREWVDAALEATRTDVLNPLRGARVLGYVAVAYYEGVVSGMENHKSLAGQLNGLDSLPTPDGTKEYDWPIVAAQTTALVMDDLFEATQTTEAVTNLLNDQVARRSAEVSQDVINNSLAYGQELGNALNDWCHTDGFAEIENAEYDLPTGVGFWTPTGPSYDPAMEPYWGTLRPLALDDIDACELPDPIEYSEEADSEFYEQAFEVYDAVNNATEEDVAQAQYWEDASGVTAAAAGHIYAIGSYLADQQGLDLGKTAEMLAVLMLDQADGFIVAWDRKYDHMLLRPETYIKNVINEAWEPVLVTPPFPEYPSGHSVSAGGYKVMFPHFLGGDVPFDNHTYDYLGYEPRHYDTFEEMSLDSGWSRLLAGVHYPMGIANGIDLGVCVGDRILTLIDTTK